MKIFHSAKSVLLALGLALAVAGCSGESAAPSPTPEAVGTYTGQDLPEVVEQLEGTPLYSQSSELTPLAKVQGATYLLIAPQDPLKALLVVEEGASPEEVSKRQSGPVKLAGKSETLDAPALVDHVKAQYQLDLKTDDKGKVIVLKVSGVPSSETAPAADSATPQDASTPAVE
jgi:hypothetical protein